MKNPFILVAAGLVLFSCGGYTDDQSKAADEFCACMETEAPDFDLQFMECYDKVTATYSPETFADEGYGLALEEKCPTTAGKISEIE